MEEGSVIGEQGPARAGRPETLRLLGEQLCLDFANTVDPRHSDHPREYLADYGDLLAWAQHAGAITDHEAGRLLREAERRPGDADGTFGRARRLRDALYEVFSAIAAGGKPPEPGLETLNGALAAALAHARVTPTAGGYEWAWAADGQNLDRPLWPVVRSAADLLTSGRLDRVRECPGADGCGWLFYDTSKNGSRRWCSMQGCGNAAKARRHYARTRAARP